MKRQGFILLTDPRKSRGKAGAMEAPCRSAAPRQAGWAPLYTSLPSRKRIALVSMILCFGTEALFAQDAQPIAEASADAMTNTLKQADIPLERFTLDRDPFWPIGFSPDDLTPAQPSAAAGPAKIEKTLPQKVEWPELRLLGFIRSAKHTMALLEGIGLVRSGDIASRRIGDRLFEWRIIGIEEDVLTYEKLGYRPVRENP